MVKTLDSSTDIVKVLKANIGELSVQLPDPEDEQISEFEFQQQVKSAWVVCDRFDLQNDIWRGRILRAVRDREKHCGDGRGTGFLQWLDEHDISKSQAYRWIELANSADQLLADGQLEPDAIDCFSKRAFVETAQADPEVQQLITESANRGERVTRREVRQLTDEWAVMNSDLIPSEIKAKAANDTIPTRYVAPLARELDKLPETYQVPLKEELSDIPDVDTLKQVTSEARQLAKYLSAAANVQALTHGAVDLEQALEEAMRIGCLNTAADVVNLSSQVEQAIAKLFTTWTRLGRLADKVYVETGESTPNLRSLLQAVESLSGEMLEVQLGPQNDQTVRLQLFPDINGG